MSAMSADGAERAGGPSDWIALWYEPWRDMHPAWFDEASPSIRGADAGLADTRRWLDRFRSPTPALRPAYRWFCGQFGIDAETPLPLHRLAALPMPWPWDPPALDRAALALGRVAHVSHCLADSRRDLAHLFAAGTGDTLPWREALRQAKARPLRPDGLGPPTGGGDAELRRWALPLMGRLADDAWPGAWSRLRLRCDPTLLRASEPLPPIPDSAAGLRRQAWRIWRHGVTPPTVASERP
ncbi:hypothetical protein [Mitsuaria sp. GD03876]|uniref:hypothetical protein n=1 Tax=Mitsuaria sp. GD03876 TaxID=2975399 RepID=UPI0024471231|nr:hypothetical protein [Mitsuaria sp. GD03876]MDH0865327.1 hypothetical protein [Mitsuaria sp. GD03876]